MRDLKLFIRLTVYYGVLALVVVGLTRISEDFASFMVANSMLPAFNATEMDLVTGARQGAPAFVASENHILYLFFATTAAILLILPVSWVYLAIRAKDGLAQALVETILVLPIVVTAIVMIVQNSLALAFSLAGIVAAVRFRHTLKSSADTLFIFAAVGVGLAAGVNALGVALIMTLFFNYTFVALWSSNYGYRSHKKAIKYMRPNRNKKLRAKEKTGGKTGSGKE